MFLKSGWSRLPHSRENSKVESAGFLRMEALVGAMKVPPFLSFSNRDREKQMNVNAKDEILPDGHEADSSFEDSIGRVADNSDSETGSETRHGTGEVEGEAGVSQPEHEEIARLAYESWQRRGCPIGTPEEDWFRAEEQFKQSLNETPAPNGGLT